MLSDRKKNLYRSLGDIASDMRTALESDNTESVERLLQLHDGVIHDLALEGDETDPDMKNAIGDAERKIRALISTIQTMQTDIRRQLSAMNNRRQIESTYYSKDAR